MITMMIIITIIIIIIIVTITMIIYNIGAPINAMITPKMALGIRRIMGINTPDSIDNIWVMILIIKNMYRDSV